MFRIKTRRPCKFVITFPDHVQFDRKTAKTFRALRDICRKPYLDRYIRGPSKSNRLSRL